MRKNAHIKENVFEFPSNDNKYGNFVGFPSFSDLNERNFDVSNLQPRQWLYGKILCRGIVSALVAPPGLGKSSLGINEAIAMASGRNLLGDAPHKRLKTVLWNGEESMSEMKLRVRAVMSHHDIDFNADMRDHLTIATAANVPMKIAALDDRGRPTVDESLVGGLTDWLVENEADVLVIDPFVSVHQVPENDNGAIDLVTKRLARIAQDANIGVLLIHHSRKASSGSSGGIGADDARGGSAFAGTVRTMRVLNRMTVEEAVSSGIPEEQRHFFFRVDSAKSNLAPVGAAHWRRLVNVHLDVRNEEYRAGEDVQAVEVFKPKSLFDGTPSDIVQQVQDALRGKDLAADLQAEDWAGHAIGLILGIATADKEADKIGRTKVNRMLKRWLANGVLLSSEVPHPKRKDRTRQVIRVPAGGLSGAEAA